MKKFYAILFVLSLVSLPLHAESFQDVVGPVTVKPVAKTKAVQVPFIVWGGDMATFYANGGLKTQKSSIYAQQGLDIDLVPGDDFVQQVRDYMEGKSPFLRGTYRMIGMASEVIGSSPETKPVIIMQMTWSAGDHAVARNDIKTLADLKGATVVLQKAGPHEGLLDDLLRDAGLSWDDIDVVWAKDLTGSADSPAEIFRQRDDVDVAFVITPDMLGLTGGLQSMGNGIEGTVRGARVLASTAERSYSIADVYACRGDWFNANKDWVTKFAAGYLKAAEEVIDLQKEYETKGNQKYMELLQLTQDIYGEDVIPSLEADAHGLLLDCTFVGQPGNIAFFSNSNPYRGFDAFQKKSLDLAQVRGYASVRQGFVPSPLDWNSDAFTKYLSKTSVAQQPRFNAEATLEELESLNLSGDLANNVIYSVVISFEPNQNEFSAVQYGVEFTKVLELVQQYGNAVIAVRGHTDPTLTLLTLVRGGMEEGIIKQTGSQGNYNYFLNGRRLDVNNTKYLTELIQKGTFDRVSYRGQSPRQVMQAGLNLSRSRAESVKSAISEYAGAEGIPLDITQIQAVGVGIREPVNPKPANAAEAAENRRVEFLLVRVSAEAQNSSDFDF
ncbi:MAG: ABC transporter substrate-binding protein [Verrucomicrobiota bacterium]